jgi:glycosyltransferase involved in cell wall biosynthesis
MSPFEPVPPRLLLPPPFNNAATRLILTLYDVIPCLYEQAYLADPQNRVFYKARLKLLREADHVLTLSKTTRDDAVRLLGLDPERITVIYGGVSDYFREPVEPREVARRGVMEQLPDITGPYILYTGGSDFRKNMEGAIAAYARLPHPLRNTYQMVLVSPLLEWQKQSLTEYAQLQGVDGRVVLPGLVSDDLLRELYQACDLFVFPSLYEGLGLPILEAMRCGAPVMVSDRGSMKELMEIDWARFNPEDPADIAQVMARALTDESLRQQLIEYGLQRSRQFTWERVAHVTADCYREIGASMVERPSWRIQQPVSQPIDAGLGRDGSQDDHQDHKEKYTRERKPQVYLSLRALQGPAWTRHRGWVRYVYDHAQQLLHDHPELIAGLHFDKDVPVPKGLADFCGYGLLQEYSLTHQRPLKADKIRDVFHIMSPIFPEGPVPLHQVFPPEFSRAGTRVVATLYDLIPLLFEYEFPADPRYRARYHSRLRLIQEADHVLAISKTTANDAIRLLGLSPERVTVIYSGISDNFWPPDLPAAELRKDVMRQVPQITGPYILSMMYAMGTRKNMEGIIEGYARLPQKIRRNFQLVLVGHGVEDIQRLIQHARKNGVEDRLVSPGLVSEELLRELYQTCDLFIFPSRYEGLGLPILEAMRCGALVVTSDRPAMNELMEIDDARFNPEDPADIARVMERALTDGDFQRYLRQYGLQRSKEFTWRSVAQATANCYREVAASIVQRQSWPIERTRSVAFCTPFPPEDSDIADYSRTFLEALCARHPVKVDVVVKGDLESYVPQENKAISLVSARQFRWLAERGHYDSIIYCMGNSPFHDYIYELLKEHRGIIWLHDVRLTGFYHWYYQQLGRDITTLPQELQPWAHRYPDYESGLLARDTFTQHEQGIYLAGEVACCAQKVVVNSRFSKELVELESGGQVPVVALPFAAPPVNGASLNETWPLLASKYGLDQFPSLVISSGYITALKCPEAVIDAFAVVASADRNLSLAFVGPCEPEYQRQLERRASHLGIEDRVLFTGYVDEAELDSWLAAARCAIQLRFPTNGEFSTAVMRCLAAGVPTIVTDHGPLRELPDDAVVKVPAQVRPTDLAQTIRRLLTDDERCERSREGALRHAQRVSFEAVADQFWTEVLCAP